MFGALAHQIYKYNLSSQEYEDSVHQLRVNVVQFIRENLELFEFELRGCLYDMKKSKKEKMLLSKKTFEELREEFNNYLSNKIAVDCAWGGSESIKAVSLLFKVNILIINENESIYYANGFNQNF